MKSALNVFISYAHDDESFKDELMEHASALIRKDLVDLWEDRQIKPGDRWLDIIGSELENCDMALLLISSAFIASEFISHEELTTLLARQEQEGIRIIPIIVRPCLWSQEDYADIQALPKNAKPIITFAKENGDRDQVWADIVRQLLQLAEQQQKQYQNTDKSTNNKPENTPFKIDIHRLPIPSARLVGRQDYLKQLDEAWNNSEVSIISLIAGGGVGKSAISYEWMERLRSNNYGTAKRVFAWSFYSQGSHDTATSSTPFFSEALNFFGHQGAQPDNDEQKARRLAELLGQQASILILDGVEPLQYAPKIQRGWFSDFGLKLFLEEVRRNGLAPKSLVLVSSRQSLVELQYHRDQGYKEINLDFLTPLEGAELLKSLGVHQGLENEFLEAVEEMGGHALAVVLLGKLLVQAHNGDIARRDLIPDLFEEANEGGHALRVMAYYDQLYWQKNAPEGLFLRLLGLFDRPIDESILTILLEKADFAQTLPAYHSANWNQMISHLRAMGLLLKEESVLHQITWDCHPLVRQYFGQCLRQENPAAWKQAHKVLFDYFQEVPVQKQPEGLQALEPLYRAVYHGCLAGEYAKAMTEVYRERILRGDEFYSLYKLGAYAADLSALSGFFPQGWDQVVTEGLTEDNQAWLFAVAAYCLMSLGRLHEAVAPRRATMVLFEKLQNWENTASTAGNLVDLLLPLGQLKEAETVAQKSINWAEQSENLSRQNDSQSKLAASLQYQGQLSLSLAEFEKAEELQIKVNADYPFLWSLSGAQICALLLNQAKDQPQRQLIYQRAQTYCQWGEGQLTLLTIAFNQLTLARCLMALQQFKPALEKMNQAVLAMRDARIVQYLPLSLLARAECYRQQNNLNAAQHDLDEAMAISQRCQMVLYEADCNLLQGRLALDFIQLQQQPGEKQFVTTQSTISEKLKLANTAYQKAEELINAMGYALRQPELTLLRARLFYYQNDPILARKSLDKAKEEYESMGYWALQDEWGKTKEQWKMDNGK